jgi:U3 small nucleolar RNA-associated protein 13
MATKQPLKTTFDVGNVIAPIFTGGSLAIDNNASILATTLGEDVVLTDPSNGRNLAKVEGVSRILHRLWNRVDCELVTDGGSLKGR